MKTFPFGKAALAVLIPLVGWFLLASAQDRPEKKRTDPAEKKEAQNSAIASRSHEDAAPDKRASSDVQFKTTDGREHRVVLIHPQSKSSANYVPGLRFHRPLGALAEHDKPYEGLPSIVDAVRRNPDGSVWLRFRVIVSSTELRKQCRDAVFDKERGILTQENLGQDDIMIEPWPLKHCVITAKDTFTNEILGVSQTDTLTAVKDEFTFTMSFTAKELSKVVGLIRSGDLAFVYSYSYIGTTTYTGSVDLKAIKNAKLIASQKLRSEQIEGKEPIFQGEANEAIRHLCVSVQKTMRVSHKDLLPLLDTPNLFQKLFIDDGQITFKDLKEDDAASLMLAAYLKPHIEQIRESSSGEKADISFHDDMRITVGDKEVLGRLERATGTKWVKEEGKERYRPHSIKKLKFQNAADTVLIDEKTTVFLAVGAENRYLEETPIPVTFTSKAAGVKATVARNGELGPYEGVPIGSMVPFFGAKVPKGYVWADGTTKFPFADWVPVHLRGEMVPDMNEHLIGGTNQKTKVGLPFRDGKIIVDGSTIPGGSFGLPANKTEVTQIAAGEGACKRGGFVAVFNPNDNYMDCRNGIHWPGFGGNFDSRPAVYRSFKTGEALQGQHKLPSVQVPLNSAQSNPRHIMCRWIIRVE